MFDNLKGEGKNERRYNYAIQKGGTMKNRLSILIECRCNHRLVNENNALVKINQPLAALVRELTETKGDES